MYKTLRSSVNGLALSSLLAISGLSSMPLVAEEIRVPIGQQAGSNIDAPRTGIEQRRVIEKYGQPLKRSATVGQPPISRWEYANFYVYFEYNRVIHSVARY